MFWQRYNTSSTTQAPKQSDLVQPHLNEQGYIVTTSTIAFTYTHTHTHTHRHTHMHAHTHLSQAEPAYMMYIQTNLCSQQVGWIVVRLTTQLHQHWSVSQSHPTCVDYGGGLSTHPLTPLGCSGFSKGDKLLVWALATQLKLSLTNDCVCGEEKCVWMAIPVKGCHYESIVLSIVSDSFWTSLTREQLPCSWNSSLIQYRVWVFRVQKRELIPHPNRYPRGVIMTGDNPQAKCASRCVCVLMR